MSGEKLLHLIALSRRAEGLRRIDQGCAHVRRKLRAHLIPMIFDETPCMLAIFVNVHLNAKLEDGILIADLRRNREIQCTLHQFWIFESGKTPQSIDLQLWIRRRLVDVQQLVKERCISMSRGE